MLHLYHDHHPDMFDRVSVTPEPRNTGPVWGRTEAHGQSSRILFITMTIIGLGTNGHRDQTDIFPLLPGRVHTGTMTNGVCSAAARGSALRLLILWTLMKTLPSPNWLVTNSNHHWSLLSSMLRAGAGLTKLISGLWDSQFTPQYLG